MESLTARMHHYYYEQHDYLARLFKEHHIDKTHLADAVTTIEDGRTAIVNGERKILFSLADYNGFDRHPEIRGAAIEAINKFGMHLGSSRVYLDMDGNRQLEHKIAHFLGAEDSLVFGTASLTNAGVISALADKNMVIFMDFYVHHSIGEAVYIAKAKGAEIVIVPHDRPDKLEQKLIKYRKKFKNAMVLKDGIYSMTGKYSDLNEYQRISEKYDALLFIDDSHGFGVISEGRGIVNHLNLKWDNLLYVGSLSKALSSVGGFVAGNRDLLSYFRKSSPTMIFSGPIPIPNVYAAIKAIDILESEDGKRINKKLWDNTKLANQLLQEAGYTTNNAVSPVLICPILNKPVLAKCGLFTFEKGIFLNLVVYPAVSKNENYIRMFINAIHKEEEIRKLADVLKEFKDKKLLF